MDIETLELFMELADVRNFSLAAANKHLSQSSLSKSILKLESELRVKLFNRDCRPIELTPAGERLYRDLESLRPQYVMMLQHMKAFAQARMISCGGVPGLRFFGAMNIIKDFQRKHEDIIIKTSNIQLVRDGLALLEQGKLDYLIAHRPLHFRPGIQAAALVNDPVCIVVPADHPFAERKSVQLLELDNCRFIESVFMNSTLQELAANCGLLANDVMVCTGIKRDEILMSLSYERRIMLCFLSDIVLYKMDNFRTVRVKGCPPMPVCLFEIPDPKRPDFLKDFRDFLITKFKAVREENGTV